MMNKVLRSAFALALGISLAFPPSAFAGTTKPLSYVGTLIAGDCLKANDNKGTAADAGFSCSSPLTFSSITISNSVINSSTINSSSIGATTPSTGSFTTLTTSGAASLGNGSTATTQATSDNTTKIATDAFVQSIVGTGVASYLPLSGGTMTGSINIGGTNQLNISSNAFIALTNNAEISLTNSGEIVLSNSAQIILGSGTQLDGSGSISLTGSASISTTAGGISTSSGAISTATGAITSGGAFTADGANVNDDLSPTGTGLVTINPATQGAMNRMTVGQTVAAAGSFTSLSANGTVTLSPSSHNVTLAPTGTGEVIIAGATTGTIDNETIGATTPEPGSFTTLSASGAFTPSGGIVGTTAGGNASSGNVGEYLSASVTSGSAISLTSTTPADIVSLSLTAGDWDISGNVSVVTTNTNTAVYGWVGTASATQPNANTGGIAILQTAGAIGANVMSTGSLRVNVSTTTTVYLGARANFTAGSATAYGIIRARRVR